MPTDNSSTSTDTSTNSYLENCQPTDEPAFTGIKGIAYDWHKLLLPSDTVFEASLETMLSSDISASFCTGDIFSPNSRK